MAIVMLHLTTNIALAVAAAGLTYGWLIDMCLFGDSPGETAGWQAFTQVAAITTAGTTLILLSTYHCSLQLQKAPMTLLQRITGALILGVWAVAGYVASMAVGEGLVFYFFLVPPLKYLAASYLEERAPGLRRAVWSDPWSAIRRYLYRR